MRFENNWAAFHLFRSRFEHQMDTSTRFRQWIMLISRPGATVSSSPMIRALSPFLDRFTSIAWSNSRTERKFRSPKFSDLNSIGAIIIASFAVLWVAAGTNTLGRRWFAALVSLSILISATIGFVATRVSFGKHRVGFDGKIYGIFVTLEVIAILIAVV